jgi:hypothetical protein
LSADNGIFISRWFTKEGHFEYRVAHRQAIENCDDPELADAYRVLYFIGSEVYDNRKEVLDKAIELYDEIMKDDFCPICEYGIVELDYDVSFPNLSYEEAEEVLDSYWKDFLREKKEKYE